MPKNPDNQSTCLYLKHASSMNIDCTIKIGEVLRVLDYTKLKNEGGLVPWPSMEELPFVNVIGGNPVHSGRFDVGNFGMRTMIGVWECTPGKFEYTYPGDEMCTLLEGKIQLQCEDGNTHNYVAGDTFYTRKGEIATWTVIETVRKVFSIHDPDSADLSQ